MAHKVDLGEVQSLIDLDNVVRIAFKCAVASPMESSRIGEAGPNIVGKDDSEFFFEFRRDRSPHALVATISVSEHKGSRAASDYMHVVLLNCFHKPLMLVFNKVKPEPYDFALMPAAFFAVAFLTGTIDRSFGADT